ncbi:MAG: hypothetical protein HQL41_05920 [Alphaproteobacteria bacterium]|nr:hypothetical protein [Alphaproteobacteria bacterium]
MIAAWITTEKGGPFNLAHPKAGDVDIEEIAASLAKLCRFNGHSRYFYSVAQHSVLVSDMLPPELRAYGLFHDAHKAYLGDLTTPIKDVLARTFLEMLRDVGGCLDVTHSLPDPWGTMTDRVDVAIFRAVGLRWPPPVDVARLVKHCDLVALATERRDLLAEQSPPWTISLPAPLPRRLVPWAWDKAMDTFLDRARRLPIQQARRGALVKEAGAC